MGSVNLDNTGSGSAITLSSDGTDLLLDGTAIGGGGGGADLYAANESSPAAQPSATGTNAIAIGDSAVSTSTKSFALGKSRAGAAYSFAANIENNTTSYGTTGEKSFAIGFRTKANNTAAISLGYYTQATSLVSTAVGSYVNATAPYSHAFGNNSTVSHNYSMVIGDAVSSTATYQVNIGGSTQDVRISEVYTLPKVDGTAGQVLSTDGNGNVSWVTP